MLWNEERDVIPHLCKFLGIGTIKKCRLVCRSWNYEATPVLKARTLIEIKLASGKHDQRRHKEWRWDTEIVEKLGFNARLKISSCKPTLRPLDLETFPMVRNLRSIIVHFYIREEWQKDLSDKIILSSSPTLEELKYEWYFHQDFPSCGEGTVFPKLKKLVLECGRVQAPRDGNPQLEIIGQALAAACPALEFLKIDCSHLYEISKMEMLQKFPQSLNSLELSGHLNADRLECLLKIPSRLKTLDISTTFDSDEIRADELPTILYKFLKKHSPTGKIFYPFGVR
ncbi:uncharacterized protein LOC118438763 [Folsomia candida]|uniref:uncharacterized protein LOC118438763 n=1 Tax=Folsomia candida TaxID=158441 RepID=UPI0016050AA5|nr:uncharacterized protein LOC118438763 [Folsomia candida]